VSYYREFNSTHTHAKADRNWKLYVNTERENDRSMFDKVLNVILDQIIQLIAHD